MSAKFCPIASGSDGNCIYVGTESTNILIDAGLSGKKIENGLALIGLKGSDIDAIFITHEHSDHIMGVGILSRRFDIPIYATELTWNKIDKHKMLGKLEPKNRVCIYEEERYIINDMVIKPFSIPHDAAQPVGYTVNADEFKISVATDVGHVTDTIKENIVDSDILLIESNHDIDMLKNGSYSWPLKKRILSDTGHLSNVSTGLLLVDIMTKRLKQIFLGHLSKENNNPILAVETVKNILIANEYDVENDINVSLAQRGFISECVVLNKEITA